jgi:uncharacterized protein
VIVADQSVVLEFLRAAMAERGPVEEVETHISHLMLGPDLVWKLKRAMRLPYADFGTPERRLAFCEREVTLNRRTAPDHYLGVRRVTREIPSRPASAFCVASGHGRLHRRDRLRR